uniref:Uncharacterized protein n=1 Tax=Strombidium rassoulzadegani TaxID=1082188 RepID=A0A7S3CJH3_9SPIT|mmetsp:Transcript_10926/g.18262  ORF Transcript_10926/g.18262 Transcript_10926/m.18262 type:complete len:171 (+) Transcript_10926:450-962(+)
MKINCLSPIALTKAFLPMMIRLSRKGRRPQIVNILSVAGLVGVPVRSFYSASKFALDGFGKALSSELSKEDVNVLQCYPAYVQTNVSKNALVGEGKALGKTDANIGQGIPVEEACDDIVRAIYLRRRWVVIGGPYFQVVSKVANLVPEGLQRRMMAKNYKQQVAAISSSA